MNNEEAIKIKATGTRQQGTGKRDQATGNRQNGPGKREHQATITIIKQNERYCQEWKRKSRNTLTTKNAINAIRTQ